MHLDPWYDIPDEPDEEEEDPDEEFPGRDLSDLREDEIVSRHIAKERGVIL